MNHDWLAKRFIDNSNDVFIKTSTRVFTFSEMNSIAFDRAQALLDFGVRNGHMVGIYLPSTIDFIESYLGCYKIRATSVILNEKWKENEIMKVTDMMRLDYIICKFSDKKKFSHFKAPLIFIEELSKSFGSCFPKDSSIQYSKNDIQSIVFTSGTRGSPKPVCLTYDNFYQSSLKWSKAVNLKKEDQYLLALPMHHIGGLAIIMRAVHVGFSVILSSQFEKYIESNKKATIISIVPTQLYELIKSRVVLNNLKMFRCIIVSGSEMSIDMKNICKAENLNIFISYGMTETCSSIAGFWLLKNFNHNKSVGKPFEGVKISKIKNNIILESSTVMKKYYGKDENEHKIKTGDSGYLKDGFLYIDGRLDEQIISGGENINPSEIVMFLNETLLPNSEITSFIFKDKKWGQSFGIIIKTNKDIDSNFIKLYLKKNIANYKIPKKIIVKQF